MPVLLGSVIVGDQMQLFLRGRLTLDPAQELQPLDVAVTLPALGDDLAEYVQSAFETSGEEARAVG